MANNTYSFTNHAIARFKKRFPELIGTEKSIAYYMAKDLYNNGSMDSSIKNNTRLMTSLYEEHGFDEPLDFIVSNLVVYVCRNMKIVTVYHFKDSMFQRTSSRFRK